MGRCGTGEYVHATEKQMEDITRDYDGDEEYQNGHWNNFVINDHTRVITEKITDKHYATRSLVRSALLFEAVEELDDNLYWIGRIYYRDFEKDIFQCIAKSEDLGDTEFRKKYKQLGGIANW